MSETLPFPFFGAGDARYFEFAQLSIYFERSPRGNKRAAIIAASPTPFTDVTIKGRVLEAWSHEVQEELIDAYAIDDGERDGTNGQIRLAADSRRRRFDLDIERWLHEVHALAPIVAVVREPDGAGGGTEYSDWHRRSLDALDETLSAFEEHVAKPRKDNRTSALLHMLLTLAEAEGAQLPRQFRAWLRPEDALADALRAGALDEATARFQAADERTRGQALRALDLEDDAVRAGVLRMRSHLEHSREGFACVLAALCLDTRDLAGDPVISDLVAAGSQMGYTPEDVWINASRRQSVPVQLRLALAGARRVGDPDRLMLYVANVVQSGTWATVDETLLAKAAAVSATWGVFENVTYIQIMREDWAGGVALVERHEASSPIPDRGLLNAALICLGAGDLERATAYAARARATGDEGAQMVDAAILLRRGERAAALDVLRAAKASGYARLAEWRSDRWFEPLFDAPDYQAIFE